MIGWLIVGLFPIPTGAPPDARAVVLPTHQECKDAKRDWESAGAKIVKDCAFVDGTATIVITTEELQ